MLQIVDMKKCGELLMLFKTYVKYVIYMLNSIQIILNLRNLAANNFKTLPVLETQLNSLFAKRGSISS